MYQRTIHIQWYSVDQSKEPFAVPYNAAVDFKYLNRLAMVGAEMQALPIYPNILHNVVTLVVKHHIKYIQINTKPPKS